MGQRPEIFGAFALDFSSPSTSLKKLRADSARSGIAIAMLKARLERAHESIAFPLVASQVAIHRMRRRIPPGYLVTPIDSKQHIGFMR